MDAGFDEDVRNDVLALDKLHDEDEAEEQGFLAPSRWWFASTAFPMTAGTFGPMASAFSICALVVRWRVSIPPGTTEGTGDLIDDPPWLTGINAAQLAIALISNLFLLLNMARRVRFSVAQPITIVGWYLSSFTLVALTACAAGPLKLDLPNYSFTQGYWYGVFAAALYFLVATLMVVTVIGAHYGHYDKDFKLTMSQRTLMLQTISFLVYLLAGAAVYSHIEGWQYLDAVYFADFTLLTVGIGDLSPSTHLGRSLLFPFAIGGIIILGLVIGSIRSLVLDRGKVKLGARMVEKERQRRIKKATKKKSEILIPIREKSSRSSSRTMTDLTERERREKEFEMMRKIQEDAASKRKWTSLCVSGSTWFVLWFAGAAVFQATEYNQGWSYFESLYFAYTSLLTIGYGDISPVSNAGKPFFVFWSLLAIPSLTILISNMGDTIVKSIRDLTLWIGHLTVLPGENGLRAGLKETVQWVTNGKVFSDEIHETPAGILGETDRRNRDSMDEEAAPKNDPDSTAQKKQGRRADIETSKAKQEGESNDKHATPTSKRHYHLILIEEISNVTKHLNSNPPRKYTFDEWAWYLKLIGEDESDSKTHRKALQHVPDNENLATASTFKDGKESGKENRLQWSWVGYRSPLMGNKEEAEWVLDRLTKTLGKELKAMRREELEGTGHFARGGRMDGGEPKERDHLASADFEGHGDDDDVHERESDRTVTDEKQEMAQE